MNKIFNHPNQKYLRKHLRSSMPKGEILLWQELKNKQFEYKFRRQYSIDNYVIDFYCPKLKLGIEIDGSTHHHDDIVDYEEQRQKYIESKGIRLERFSSQEIFEDINNVINQIYVLCEEQKEKLLTPPETSP
ncbi:DUF559 domain-containing protein [Patescibacteria group bacterium]|nr:DUF559 domain-containing protein [Patescibacteria group bacterium]